MASSFNAFTTAQIEFSTIPLRGVTPISLADTPTFNTSSVSADTWKTGFSVANQGIDLSSSPENSGGSAQLRYPNTNWPTKQDYILFTALAYGKGGFNIKDGNVGFSKRQFTPQSPTVCLPIQSKIADNNLVGWGEGRMTPIQIAAAGLSEGIIGGKINLESTNDSLLKSMTDSLSKRASDLFFAEKASSTTGLLSRIEGAIANPNLELLFSGPELRQFQFSFIMSARDKDEATQIRRIIRFFKQHMAVKTTKTNIFLKSPDVFKVQYKSYKNKKGEDVHPSINRIKECALTNLGIDYTPAGTYSTYNDAKNTMTAYSMTLQFQELEPIFANEYTDIPTDEIGF